ncbi:MAG: hypothetical protein ACI9LN_001444 [Saprospiraceae bacterium]|jgi:hypothetical protein
MKKYTLFAALILSFAFSQDITAQNARKSDAERQQIHNQANDTQQMSAVNSEVQSIIFRFETAYEDKDVESTKVLQETLGRLMQNGLDYQVKSGVAVDSKMTIMVADFAKFKFDFASTETKEDVSMKGVPSAFMKTMK